MSGEDEYIVLPIFYRLPLLSVRSMIWGQMGLVEIHKDGSGV